MSTDRDRLLERWAALGLPEWDDFEEIVLGSPRLEPLVEEILAHRQSVDPDADPQALRETCWIWVMTRYGWDFALFEQRRSWDAWLAAYSSVAGGLDPLDEAAAACLVDAVCATVETSRKSRLLAPDRFNQGRSDFPPRNAHSWVKKRLVWKAREEQVWRRRGRTFDEPGGEPVAESTSASQQRRRELGLVYARLGYLWSHVAAVRAGTRGLARQEGITSVMTDEAGLGLDQRLHNLRHKARLDALMRGRAMQGLDAVALAWADRWAASFCSPERSYRTPDELEAALAQVRPAALVLLAQLQEAFERALAEMVEDPHAEGLAQVLSKGQQYVRLPQRGKAQAAGYLSSALEAGARASRHWPSGGPDPGPGGGGDREGRWTELSRIAPEHGGPLLDEADRIWAVAQSVILYGEGILEADPDLQELEEEVFRGGNPRPAGLQLAPPLPPAPASRARTPWILGISMAAAALLAVAVLVRSQDQAIASKSVITELTVAERTVGEMPRAIYNGAIAVDQDLGIAYIVGGHSVEGDQELYLDSVWAVELEHPERAQRLPDYPLGLGGAAAVVADGYLWVVGGNVPLDERGVEAARDSKRQLAERWGVSADERYLLEQIALGYRLDLAHPEDGWEELPGSLWVPRTNARLLLDDADRLVVVGGSFYFGPGRGHGVPPHDGELHACANSDHLSRDGYPMLGTCSTAVTETLDLASLEEGWSIEPGLQLLRPRNYPSATWLDGSLFVAGGKDNDATMMGRSVELIGEERRELPSPDGTLFEGQATAMDGVVWVYSQAWDTPTQSSTPARLFGWLPDEEAWVSADLIGTETDHSISHPMVAGWDGRVWVLGGVDGGQPSKRVIELTPELSTVEWLRLEP